MQRFFRSTLVALLSLFVFVPLASANQTAVLLPLSAGNYQQWTPKTGTNHVTMVDETSCNGTTDYNDESTVSQRDSYGISVASIPDGSTITQIAITPCASRNNNGAGSSTLDVFYRLNGINSSDTGAYALAGTTPSVLSPTSFSSLSVNKSPSTTLEIGAVFSAGNKGARLSQISTQVTYTPLATPSGLTAAATGSAIGINWIDNSSNEDGFKIERSDNGGSFNQIATVSANTTTYTESLGTGSYTYRVRAYNGGGNSGYSNTSAAYVLAAPTNLTVVSTGSAETLTWNDNATNEDGYKIERAAGAGSFVEIKTLGSNSHSYTEGPLSVNTYTYRVRAYKSTSNSAYSNSDSASILLSPLNLTGTLSGTTVINLSWIDNATGEDGYIIERSDNAGPSVQIATLSANTISYVDSASISAGNTYAYKVRAYTNTGDMSGNAFLTVVDMNAPSGLTAVSSGTAASGSAVTLNWIDNSTNESNFEIQIASGGGSFGFYRIVSANTTNYVTPALPVGDYSFQVRAINGSSRSDFSNVATTAVLATPTGLSASVLGSNVTLNWIDNSNEEDGYLVERSDNGGSFNQIGSVGSDVTNFSDPGLAMGSYLYRVRTYKGLDTSFYSATASAIIP